MGRHGKRRCAFSARARCTAPTFLRPSTCETAQTHSRKSRRPETETQVLRFKIKTPAQIKSRLDCSDRLQILFSQILDLRGYLLLRSNFPQRLCAGNREGHVPEVNLGRQKLNSNV